MSTVVYGGFGKLWPGAPCTPANTMFQFDPFQLPIWSSREIHCCCEPEFTEPVTTLSARKPPLDQPLSSSCRLPRTSTRRSGAAWETAQVSVPDGGTISMFSASRQKFSVALPPFQSAWTCTLPLMSTESGVSPRPAASS